MTKLFSLLHRRTGRRRAALLFLVLLSVIALSCASRQAPSLSELAAGHHPLRIAADVQSGPGSLAWSRDGKTLAYLNGKVNLYDINSAERKTVPITTPRFLCWSEEGRLFVLYQEQGRGAIMSMDRRGEDPRKITADDGAEAIYSAANTGDLLVLTNKVASFPHGTGITLRIFALDRNGLTKKKLYSLGKSYPWRELDLRRLLAWTHAGLNPVDNSLLVIEYAKPPVFPLVSRVISIDPVSAEASEIFSNTQRTVFTAAGWSPDGRSVALTDGDGMLRIRTARGDWITPSRTATGFYPSWNPKADMVYLGGSVIDLDRKDSEALLTESAWSIAQWSPDGTKLAVASGGELWLFSGFSPLSSRHDEGDASLSKKMALLQNLFREGLITLEEYKERRSKIMDLKNK